MSEYYRLYPSWSACSADLRRRSYYYCECEDLVKLLEETKDIITYNEIKRLWNNNSNYWYYLSFYTTD